VLTEARAWQNRPLDPVVFLDAIVVKVRDNNTVQAKPAYLAVGIDTDGEKHALDTLAWKPPAASACPRTKTRKTPSN
jgi:putative transposase